MKEKNGWTRFLVPAGVVPMLHRRLANCGVVDIPTLLVMVTGTELSFSGGVPSMSLLRRDCSGVELNACADSVLLSLIRILY